MKCMSAVQELLSFQSSLFVMPLLFTISLSEMEPSNSSPINVTAPSKALYVTWCL